MIDILVPVLGRPQNAQPLVDSLLTHTQVPFTLIWIVTLGDDDQGKACREAGGDLLLVHLRRAGDNGFGEYAKKINAAYRETDSEFVFTAADDIEFTRNWDVIALDTARTTGAGMIGTNDDANPLVKRGRHSTHTLFRRTYIDETGATFFDGPGVVFHEGYKHQWVDTEAVKAAQDRGQWAFARRSVVRHHHPFYDKTVALDDTYRKALGDASHDSDLYRQRLQAWTRQNRATVL